MKPAKLAFNNLIEILTDSYSPAIILPQSDVKIHYSALRHAVNLMRQTTPFNQLRAGQIVTVSLENSVEFIVTFFALVSVRAVVNPIKLSLTDEELAEQVKTIKPKAFISSKEMVNFQRIANICSKYSVPFFQVSVSLNKQIYNMRRIIRKLHPSVVQSTVAVRPNTTCSLISGNFNPVGQTKDRTNCFYDKRDLAVIIHTHGTTGMTKLVPLTHGNILENIEHISRIFDLNADDSTYLIMPMYQAHGLIGVLLPSFYSGSTVLIPKEMSIENFWFDISKYGVSWFSGVPLYHQMLLSLPKTNIKMKSNRLRFVQSCGYRIDPELLLEFEQFIGAPIVTSYTLTEACHMVCSNIPNRTRKPGSVGLPIGVELRLIDPSGQLTTGIGEICIHGPSVFESNMKN
jgi:oxalate---CoA ligase